MTPFAAMTDMWMSAWLQPWTALQTWNEYWREQWKGWLANRAAGPAAWMPALAADRRDQPDAINFFLPWLPRIDALVMPLEGHAEEDAVRLMLRAAMPQIGGTGGAEWLTVDATIRHAAGDEPPALEAQPAQPAVIEAQAPAAPPARRTRTTTKRPVTKAAAEPTAMQAATVEPLAAAEAPPKARRAAVRKPAAARKAAAREGGAGG